MTYFYKRLKANKHLIAISSMAGVSIGIISVSSLYVGLALVSIILVIMLESIGLSIPLIILTMPIRGVSLGTLGEGNLRIGDLIIGLLIVFYFLRDPVSRTLKLLVANPLDFLVILFIVFNVFSIAWADDKGIALLRSGKLIRNLAVYILFRYLFLRNPNRAISFFVSAISISSLVIVGDILYWIWKTEGMEALLNMRHAASLSSGSSALAVVREFRTGNSLFFEGPENWLLFCIFIVCGRAMWCHQRKQWLLQLFCNMVVLSAVFIILILLERGMIFGMAGGIIVVLLLLQNRRRYFMDPQILLSVIVVVLLLSVISGPDVFMKRFSLQTMQSDPAVDIRLEMWKEVLVKWSQSPLIGVGIGNTISEEKFPTSGGVPHNVYLQMLSDLGLIGFGFFSGLLAMWAKRLLGIIKTLKKSGFIKEMLFAISIFGGMTSYLVAGLTAQDFYSSEPWIYLAITSAMMSRSWMEMVQKQAVGRSVSNLSIK